jgi:hypothetical protein
MGYSINFMRSALLGLFISLGHLLASCKTSHYKALKEISEQHPAIDTNEVAIIPFDLEMRWVFDSTYKAATLSSEEIKLVNRLLGKCIVEYNESVPKDKRPRWGIDFSKFQYRKQYVAVLNDKGEKIVWVNGLCHTWDDKWKRQVVEVMDGGNCYFDVKINLSTMECFDIGVHGYA